MVPKYKELFEFVLSNNGSLLEVVPVYKIIVHYYDRKEIFYTKDITEANSISAPHIEIEIENQEEYNQYLTTLNTYNQRAEYIWYLLLKHFCQNAEEEFEEIYKNMWDKYYKEGGWDLVAHNMEKYYNKYYNNVEKEQI